MRDRLFVFLLCLTLAFCPGAMAEDQNDPCVVKVGDIGYNLSEVQQYWNNLAQFYTSAGISIDESELPQYEQSIIESFVSMGVIENKFNAFGLEQQIDPQKLEQDAAELYLSVKENYAEQLKEQYGISEEEALRHALTFMELNRYTMDTARDQAMIDMRESIMVEHMTADIDTVDPDEVQAYYDTNYVAPSREAYENDIDAFELDVLYYGGDCYFIPEGYRYVRHILLAASAEDAKRLQDKQTEIDEAENAVQTAENRISGLELLGNDTTAAQAEYGEAAETLDKLTQEYQAVIDEVAAGYDTQVQAIQADLAKGVPFDTLLQTYNQDEVMPEEGYMVCARSTLWTTEFRDAAMALTTVGEVGSPVHTAAGVHIFEYTGDAPAGAVPLTGDLERIMTEETLLQKKYNVLAGFVAQWREEYEIYTDVSLLDTPPCLQAE